MTLHPCISAGQQGPAISHHNTLKVESINIISKLILYKSRSL